MRVWLLALLPALAAMPLTVYAQAAPLPAGSVPAGVRNLIARHVAGQVIPYSGDCQQVMVQPGVSCSLTTALGTAGWSIQFFTGSAAVESQTPYDQFTVTPDQAAAATASPLPPAAIPTSVIAAITAHVSAQNYGYAGDCQQVSSADAGLVCSSTTLQADGSWLVRLYTVYPSVPLGQFPYDQFTVTPNQATAAVTSSPSAPVAP